MRIAAVLFCFVTLSAHASPELGTLARYGRLQEKSPESKTSLTSSERKTLFHTVSNHPVTNLNNLGTYDPTGIIGFCFGRAMGAHLMGRQMNVSRASLRKLFIIGDLRSGQDPEWRFHVTTLVKGKEDGKWWAIDPIMTPPTGPGGPIRMEEWVRIVRSIWDKQGKAKLYFTGTDTVLPDVTKDPNGTTGDAVLEVGFDPLSKSGFTARTIQKVPLFETDEHAEAGYFMSVKEPESDRFKFDGITIDTQFIDYHNYFIALLGDLTGDVPFPRSVPRAFSAAAVAARRESAKTPQLYSPRFDRLFRQSGKP